MALSNLIVKISADTKEFVVGTTRVKRDAEGLKTGMKMLSQAITEGSVKLKEMAAAGQGASKEYKELKTQVAQARSALRGMGGELNTLKKTADSGFGGRDIADALTGGLIGGGVAGLAITAIGSIKAAFTGAIQDASNLGETMAKTGVIFGDAQGQIQQFADGAAQSIGQSKQQAMDAAATFGVFGKAAGLTGNELASFSVDLVKLSSDMASFSNTTPEQAITAIGAALRGESEPIRQYGVLLNDAAMRQKAMELGIYDGNGALDAQQKILAAQALIFEQTTDAQGDFQRTSEGLANQQRILAAELQNSSAQLGTALVPAALAGTKVLISLVNGTTALANGIKNTLPGLTAIAAGLAIYNAQALIAKASTINLGKAKLYYTTAVTAAKNAQNLFNLAFAMSPVGRVVKIIGLAVTAFGLLYTTVKPLRDGINNLFSSFNLFGDSAEESEKKTAALNATLENTPDRIAKIKRALNDLDWTKAQPPKEMGLPGLAGGGKFSDYAKQAGIFSGPSANTTKATQEYIKQLKETRDELVIGSDAYKRVSAEIDKYDKSLQKTTTTQKKTKAVEVRVVSNLMGMDETTMFDLTDKMRKQVGEANILQGIFKNIDVLDVEINALSELIKEGVQAGVDPTVLQPYIDRLNELLKKQEGLKLGPDIVVDEESLAMGNILEGAANKMRKDKLLANAFGEEFDAIGGEMSMLKDIITQGIEDNIGADKLDPLIERFKALSAVQKDLLSQKEIIAEFGNIAASAFEQIGSGSMTAAQGFAAVGKAALNASLDFLKGKLLESTGSLMKWAAKLGPLGIPIATAGVGALFALVKGAMSKSRAVAFADGGIVSGPVMGLVGEYAGASRNPEVIAPLDKLQSMLQGSGSTHVTGTFRVQGSDLVLALDNAQRKMSQFRV